MAFRSLKAGIGEMMKFTVYLPRSQKQALTYISKARRRVFLLAGGTDLLVRIRKGELKPRCLVDLSHLRDLRYIKTDGNLVKVGALTRIADLEDYSWPKSCEAFRQVAEKFGGPSIANMATVAGNLCVASPSADLLPILLCLDSRAVLRSRKGDRVVRVSDLLLSECRTGVRPDEIIVEVQFETPPTSALCVFKKIGRRSALFMASVSLAAFIQLDRKTKRIMQARVALNALRRNLPQRSKLVEASMAGKVLDRATIDEAASELSKELHMVSDVSGSADYKTEAAKVLLEDQLLYCASRLGER